MRVLRLCSVFEPPATPGGTGVAFDPVGGMQYHTGQLTRALDDLGVVQTVVMAWAPGAARDERLGPRSRVVRLGVAVRRCRQLYSIPAAVVLPQLAARADVVHAHLGEDLAVLPLAFWAAGRRRLPVVVTVHCSLRHTLRVTDPRTAILRTVGAAVEHCGERGASAVIALTPRLAGRLAADGVDPGRIHVIPSGVDPRLFETVAGDPTPEIGRPRVLFVGRLATQKAVHTLIKAVPLLRSGDARVLLVGDGPLRAQLERDASAAGLADRIRFAGFVSHDAVSAYLYHADVLVLPSIYEELGSVLVEAMYAGVPIVASSVGGIPDLVTDRVTGRLVPPEDPVALASAIDDLLANPQQARRMAAAAKQTATSYRWDRLAERVLAVYETVLVPRTDGATELGAGAA